MKIGILADTHLGAKPYGLTEKEKDIYHSFVNAIKIILKEQVDLVIVAGDLFDTKKISFESYYYANFLSVFDNKIFFIEGNHDEGVSEFFKALNIQKQDILPLKNNLYVAGVDYYHNHDVMRDKIKEIVNQIDPKHTILVLHANLYEAMPYLKDKSKCLFVKDFEKFKFVVLGHIHNSMFLENKYLVVGSLERLDITNQEERKIWFLDINEFNEINVYYRIIPTRKILQTDNKEEIFKAIRVEKLKPIVFYTGKPDDIKPSELLLFEKHCLLFKFKKEVEQTIDEMLNIEIQITKEKVEDLILNFLQQFKVNSSLKDIFIKHFPNIVDAEKELETWLAAEVSDAS